MGSAFISYLLPKICRKIRMSNIFGVRLWRERFRQIQRVGTFTWRYLAGSCGKYLAQISRRYDFHSLCDSIHILHFDLRDGRGKPGVGCEMIKCMQVVEAIGRYNKTGWGTI
jgi:hypothetical protein